jgi:hypothetical protein
MNQKELAISSLKKWWNPESYFGDPCSYCKEAHRKCSKCRAPLLLCNDPKWMPSLWRKIRESIPQEYGRIKHADQRYIRLIQWAVMDLIIHGYLKKRTRDLLEKVVLKVD